LFSNVGDRSIIDGFFVNGSARLVGVTSAVLRQIQSGFIYQYAFAMVLGIVVFLFWWLTLRVV
jgi:NADH-quinone oxidoreductase subunit L